MELERIRLIYFSPTGGTRKVGRRVAGVLAQRLGLPVTEVNLTRQGQRRRLEPLGREELLVMATPVYAGRVPNKLLPDYQALLRGQGGPAVPVCVFGNRNFDEGLRELTLLLEGNGFQIAGAGAFAGRHAFSDGVGTGRPDDQDLEEMDSFAHQVADKLAWDALPRLELDRGEIGPYYTPLKEDGAPAKFLKAKPKTDWSLCDKCGACPRLCPVECIDYESMDATGPLCIKCQACVRGCPQHAKYFDDPDFLSHVAMLERDFTRRADNVTWL